MQIQTQQKDLQTFAADVESLVMSNFAVKMTSNTALYMEDKFSLSDEAYQYLKIPLRQTENIHCHKMT